MAQDLRFLSNLVEERGNQVARGLPTTDGHGVALPNAVKQAIAEMSDEVGLIATGGPYGATEERAKIRELLRLLQKTDVLYRIVSRYAPDVGRTDVPMGLLYLVDELIRDLLPTGADPLLHLDDGNMYSTWSIFDGISSILDPKRFDEPHPVAFNIPGLDPANALFSPILAHEVGHTCWQRGLGRELQAALDVPAIEAELQGAVDAGVSPRIVMEQFLSWLQELMCDALAATLAGPSFLFASTVFLPGPAQHRLNMRLAHTHTQVTGLD